MEEKNMEAVNKGETTHHRHKTPTNWNQFGSNIFWTSNCEENSNSFRNCFYSIYSSCSCSSSSSIAFDGSRFDEMIVTSFLLEKLREMVFAVQDSFKRCIVRWRKRAASMRTLEAWFMVTQALHSYLKNFWKTEQEDIIRKECLKRSHGDLYCKWSN